MLFHVEQVHTPENCPYGRGGSTTLFDATVAGVKVMGAYGSFVGHTMYYLVEADNLDALNQFLVPGMKTCSATSTEVAPSSP